MEGQVGRHWTLAGLTEEKWTDTEAGKLAPGERCPREGGQE